MVAEVAPLEDDDPSRVGRYRLLGRLGAGGMGQVYLGRSPGGREAAVKLVRPELAGDAEFRRRFAREVAAARRVSGAFTAGVLDADAEGTPPWLATVYVPGPSLADAVANHGPLPLESVLALGAGLAEALEAIHAAGVVHRDLKPSNVLLAADGPRVIDFGISVAAEATALTRTGTVIGTPGYMSPEQLTGGTPVGPPSDVFSLASVLVYAATGTGPFGDGGGHALSFRVVYEAPELAAVPGPLRALAEPCLAKKPDQRPTVAWLLDNFAEAVGADGDAATVISRNAAWLPEPIAARTVRDEPRDQPRDTFHSVPTQNAPESARPPAAPPAGVSRRRGLAAALAVTAVAAGAGLAAWRLREQNGEGGGTPPASGEQLWQFDTEGEILRELAAGGGAVYVADESGLVYALDAASGEERWRHDTEGGTSFEALGWTGDSDTLGDGLAYSEDDGLVYIGGQDLYALDASDGGEVWRFTDGAWMVPTPAPGEGAVYAADNAGGVLHAVISAVGSTMWFRDLNGPITHGPALSRDGAAVYVGTQNGWLYAFDAVSSEEIWTNPYHERGSVRSTPAAGDGLVYATSDDRLFAVDADTGELRWRFTPSNSDPDSPMSSPVLADGVVYVHKSEGTLHARDAASGDERWTYRSTDLTMSRAPVVAGGTVYVTTRQGRPGRLLAVDAATGEERWTAPFTPGTEEQAPVVLDGVVYVATGQRVYAFQA
jgi:outer membrane protein assembly factor BamB